MSEEARVTFYPWKKTIDVEPDTTLLNAAEDAGVSIEGLCAGNGRCGTCKAIIGEGEAHLTPITTAEEQTLSSEQLGNGYRLTCRAKVSEPGEVSVTVPPDSQKTAGIVLTEGQELEYAIDPLVKKYHVDLPVPSLSDNVADFERIGEALEDTYEIDIEDVDYEVQRELPGQMRTEETEDRLEVTATVYDDQEIIDVEPGLSETAYGLAIDIGTTTVATYLVNLKNGETEAISSQLNPQTKQGGDIMTRMRYTRRNDDGRETLKEEIRAGINETIEEVIQEAGIDREDIYESVFVGNTAMHHLFLGIDPTYVAGSPYVAAREAPIAVKARELGIDINDAGYVYWLPVSGGWVGPDKVSVLLVSGHYKESPTTVCIDIGTNGEISVGNDEEMLVTSAPAGPALEGAELRYGVRAQSGAIETLRIDPETLDPEYETIDDEPPNGITGSGVIDALAQLFEVGLVDQRGKFRDEVLDHPRVRENDDGELEYVVAYEKEAALAEDIVLTQNDIRSIQMAKAAIQAGTRVLMDELDIENPDRVLMAGAFGNYIDKHSAMTIGMYPDIDPDDVVSLGNAAGVGAKLALLDKERRAEAERIVDEVEYFEIAGTDVFQENFMESMYLPHQDFDLYPHVKEKVMRRRELEAARLEAAETED
ncbi:ASKHA domain-containing protein [Halodesulfurarchaeum formicicum]|uniref:Ferredoxin n=1 Tax=Halodesulfurarchaeum formicicum TaxID=1873524 RepID=A0A1J1ADM8_9EURY|nr:ASKHA domain-containing protein [Halodesulfurarchaeum formicicum]APE96246.1 ferredoxin [Halodesulfurarchaeum formicicum]